MSVANGDINLNVNMRGTGDAPAKLEQTRTAINKVEASAKSTTTQFTSLRGGISEVASVASSAAGEMTRDMSAVVGLVSDATSKFGVLGTVITGVVAVVGALTLGFDAIENARFEQTARSLQGAATAAGNLAGALTTAAQKARELQSEMKSAEVRALTAQIATANARGDTVGAAGLAAQLTRLVTGNEAGALRSQGQGALGEGINALVQGAAGRASLAKLDERIAYLTQVIADPAFTFKQNTGRDGFDKLPGKDVLAYELGGLITQRLTVQAGMSALPAGAVSDNMAAASALYKAADAVQTQGLVESSTNLLTNALGVLKAAAATTDGPGGGPSGGPGRQPVDVGALVSDGEGGGPGRRSSGRKGGDLRALFAAGAERSDQRALGDDIRDFTAALTAALPEMDAFGGALTKIGEIWSQWGKGAVGTKTAVVGSIAAIGQAGAAQIKNEQLRAGVLSIIELGLGFASIENPVVAAAHFTASAVLGGIAAFGGGGGSSSKSSTGGGGSRTVRPMNDNAATGALVVNINAPWFGPSPQEASAGLAAFLGRAAGTGWDG